MSVNGQVSLREVGLRDGLQLVSQYPSTDVKRRWISREYEAGIRRFEVGSFVPFDRFPQFADVSDLIAWTKSMEGAVASVLAVNKRGVVEALASEADEVTFVLSATEEHSLRNSGRARGEAIEILGQAVNLREASNSSTRICAAIAMAFGCSISGEVSQDEVLLLAEEAVAAGADALGLADTIGFAGPKQVRQLVSDLRAAFPEIEIGIHLHDTRGLGIANAFAAIDAGANIVDASLGGLGGCPFAPGATGNVVMEDIAFLYRTLGLPDEIDVDGLIAARNMLEMEMPEERFYGNLARAGSELRLDR